MAIYNPPQRNSWGDVLTVAGTTTASVGGLVAATGAGAVPGAIIGSVGAIASGIGSLINAGQEKEQQDYLKTYNASVTGERNMGASINNNRDIQRSRDRILSLSGIQNL